MKKFIIPAVFLSIISLLTATQSVAETTKNYNDSDVTIVNSNDDADEDSTQYSEEFLKNFALACMQGCVGDEPIKLKVAFCVCACGIFVRNLIDSGYPIDEIQDNLFKLAPTDRQKDACFDLAKKQVRRSH
jgi:hypothetical protein